MLVISSVTIGDLRDEQLLKKHREADIDRVLEDMSLPDGRPDKILALLVAWSHDDTTRPFTTWAKAVERANAEVASGSIFSSMLRPPTAATGKLGTTKLQATWGNCGKTGAYILEGLAPHVTELSEALRRPPQQPVRLSFGRGLLSATLTDIPRSGGIRLLDCSFTSLHTFFIEVHSDGRRYLHQGFQSSYSCTWWEGTEEAGLKRQFLKDPDVEALLGSRKQYGNGMPVNDDSYKTFVRYLDAALTAEDWQTFTKIWCKLPFCPTSGEADNMRTRVGTALPVLEITSYTVTLPTEPPLLVTEHGSVAGAVIPREIG